MVSGLPWEAIDHVDPDSMVELSKVLDLDGSGYVSQDEFVHGMIGLRCQRRRLGHAIAMSLSFLVSCVFLCGVAFLLVCVGVSSCVLRRGLVGAKPPSATFSPSALPPM